MVRPARRVREGPRRVRGRRGGGRGSRLPGRRRSDVVAVRALRAAPAESRRVGSQRGGSRRLGGDDPPAAPRADPRGRVGDRARRGGVRVPRAPPPRSARVRRGGGAVPAPLAPVQVALGALDLPVRARARGAEGAGAVRPHRRPDAQPRDVRDDPARVPGGREGPRAVPGGRPSVAIQALLRPRRNRRRREGARRGSLIRSSRGPGPGAPRAKASPRPPRPPRTRRDRRVFFFLLDRGDPEGGAGGAVPRGRAAGPRPGAAPRAGAPERGGLRVAARAVSPRGGERARRVGFAVRRGRDASGRRARRATRRLRARVRGGRGEASRARGGDGGARRPRGVARRTSGRCSTRTRRGRTGRSTIGGSR